MQKQKLTATQGLFYTRLIAYYQTTGSLPSIRKFIKHLKEEYGLTRGITAVGGMLNTLRAAGYIVNDRPFDVIPVPRDILAKMVDLTEYIFEFDQGEEETIMNIAVTVSDWIGESGHLHNTEEDLE